MSTQTDDAEGWDFDLNDPVTLLWSNGSGTVIGRTEYVHENVKYLVEYANDVGELVRTWVYGEAIDHVGRA